MLFRLCYRLGLFFYHVVIRLAANWDPKAKAWVVGRRGWAEELSAWRSQCSEAKVWWMHCASLGEFEQGRSVLEAWRARHPEWKIVLTFYSPSGYEQRKNYPLADYITYLPADSPQNASAWRSILRPDMVLFVKYEFWYFHLRSLQTSRVPTYLIAASFRPGQIFFRWYGKAFRKLLAGFTHIFVQNATDQAQLATIGITHSTLAGDPRLDRTLQIAAEVTPIPELEAFKGREHLLIAGSSWPPDEDILLSDPNRWASDWKLLIVPHDIGEKHIQQICDKLSLPYLRYSQLGTDTDLASARVLILDTIGLLARAYTYGNLAYIGGGFGSGLHNTLEPTAHGLPVFFGPKYHKFPEAVHFVTSGGGFTVTDADDFQQQFQHLVENAAAYQMAQKSLVVYFHEARGATQRIVAGLSPNEKTSH